ncbi:putative disease resistance RPP13-like protein 1 [Cajanus cajan]|uniref:Disease resistance RPP13-like protein 1 n=1 Tax=Cajanus cajan TaxID=3821 RepID=A0A151SP49_CAJCA|nr:putative disease resistance RPP13-like protein 1 [Cajanus cajan]XP_020226665.1 putative disease resistance RPP13-like protein 1 [Cajanus cajan]KYP56512.1 Putative disease resistance RPP13-like protein 1 [Cajanus cajan]
MAAGVVGGAFLSASLQVTFDRLASRDILNYFHGRKLKDEMLKKLGIALNSINQVLEDAEERQYRSPNVMKWLDELKEAIYEAELLFDEVATEALRLKLEAQFQPATSKVRGFLTAFINPFDKEIASRVKEVLENIKYLAEQTDMLGLRKGTCAGHEVGSSWKLSNRLPTTSLVDESSICGREGDKEKIIKILVSDNVTCNQVPIISIVGLGGIGKTTLAQLVYNDQKILDQFDLKAWVYVSQDFDVVAVTKAILKALGSLSEEERDLNLLQIELKQRLMGKKFLLVLDDVWNENYSSWEALQIPFIFGSSGSRILVTTRTKKVASVMNSSQLLHLKPLEKEYSWKLFANFAFHDKDTRKYPNLVSVGSKIVEKCGGLPLAIRTLGNILRAKFSHYEWVKILESDIWHLPENDSSINPALRLSYHNLPSYLKRCFAYSSIFPKGYEFDSDQLIKLWMAEGFLSCCQISKSEEELGSEFFNELVARSFFQQSRRHGSRFTMHDLLNDLAKSVSGDFCLQIEGNLVQDIPNRTLHISCAHKFNLDIFLEHICKCNRLRCLMALESCEFGRGDLMNSNAQRVLFSRIKYLCVLSFNNCLLTELVDEISNLKLLRYLDLSNTKIKKLPDSICMLHNLQTLLLEWCYHLTELPLDFHKLVNLRHLDVRMSGINKMPKHIGGLIHLKTLTCFYISKLSGFDIKELGNLNHLQGTLSVLKLENVTDPADAMEANMNDKKHLEELVLNWGDKFGRCNENEDSITERHVLEALQPNGNLKRLTVLRYDGTSFPSWFGGSHLPNLTSISLTKSKFCFMLPPFGKLPSLKELSISCFYSVEVIGPEFYGKDSSNTPFKSLEILKFEEMSAWKEWCSFEGEGLSCLKELSIKRCPWLRRALPQHLPCLQKLEICECQHLEDSLPEAAGIHELVLRGCEKFLLKDLSSSLKKATICGTRVIESSLEQILLLNAFLEELKLHDFDGPNLKLSSLDMHRQDSLSTLTITSWYSSSLPFALDMFANLHSLHFYDCPQLESFPEGGLPSSLCKLEIEDCPKLVASREEWGLFKLHSLKELRISDDFENVESFPEEGLLPPTLSDLYLIGCSKLTTTKFSPPQISQILLYSNMPSS